MIKKKVLVVEDNEFYHDAWRSKLADKIILISAFSIEEAKTLFDINHDIDAIVMDACVPGDRPTTPSLVTEFRRTFKGPMIAVSSLGDYRRMLIRAGCDHESAKNCLPQKLLEVLGL